MTRAISRRSGSATGPSGGKTLSARHDADWDRFPFAERSRGVSDPTDLPLIDEVDRIKMSGLEQLRAIFDSGVVRLGAALYPSPLRTVGSFLALGG